MEGGGTTSVDDLDRPSGPPAGRADGQRPEGAEGGQLRKEVQPVQDREPSLRPAGVGPRWSRLAANKRRPHGEGQGRCPGRRLRWWP
jgi:hypothetical protein